MITFNTTYNVSPQIESEWLAYMKSKHIPAILATGLATDVKLLRLLTEIETDGITYTNQFSFKSMADFLTYQSEHQPLIIDTHHEIFNGHYVSFRTLLQEV